MQPDIATSLSITASRQGHTEAEADVRAIAATIAEPLGFRAAVETRGNSVTVSFPEVGDPPVTGDRQGDHRPAGKKLEQDPQAPRWIVSEPGVGYRFRAETA